MIIPKWLNDFTTKYANNKNLEKKTELNSEDYLMKYIYKTEEVLPEEQFNKVAGLLAKDNDYSDQKIRSTIHQIKEQDLMVKANKMYKKSGVFSSAQVYDPYDKGAKLSVKGSITKGLFKNIFASDKKSVDIPTDFDSIVKYCEKKSGYKLSNNELNELIRHAKKNKFDKLTNNKVILSCQRFVDNQKLASKGKLINSSNRIQTIRQQVEAGLEVFKNLSKPSPKEEAENLRYVTDEYPKDKDARDEDIKRQVEQENDTKKQMKKEKSVDRTMGLKRAAKEDEEEYKTEVQWEMKGTPKGFGKEQRPEVSGEGKKLVERYSKQIDELLNKMKPITKKISNLKDKIKGIKEVEETPIQNEINAVAQKLEKTMTRMSDTDTVLIEHKGKLLALISKYETSKIGFMDFLRDKFKEQGIESTLDRWVDEWNKIEPTIGNIEKKIIKRFTKVSAIFDMYDDESTEISDADLSELNDILDNIISFCDLMEEETSELEYEIEEELQEVDEDELEEDEEIKYEEEDELEELPIAAKIGDDFIHVATKKEYLIDKISKNEVTLTNILGKSKKVDIESFKKEYAEGKGQTKIAVNGRPNDIDKCRDCAFYNSGIGTAYYKCAECIHAYSEEEIKDMGDDVNELSDYFLDRGISKSMPENASNFYKKHASRKDISENDVVSSLEKKSQPAIETPTKPVEAPPTPSTEPATPTPDSPPEDDPFNPPKPAKLPKPKACKYYMNKSAAYEDEANEKIKSFWNNIPEEHPYSQHPVISKHGKELSENSFKFTSDKYTGDPTQTQQTLQRIQELESEHQEELIQLAKEVASKIFNIDESKLNANLGHPGEERSQQEQETPQEELAEEQEQSEITPELRQQINKRITMNALTHGSATHAMMTAHYLVDEGLRRISPELLDLYTQFTSGSHKIYWLIDFTEMYADPQMQGRIGDSEVEYNEETGQAEVKATAIMFPILVHELIKGVMELMSLHGLKDLDEEQLNTIYDVADQLIDEQWLIQIGPELWRKFLKVVPEDFPLANVIAELSKQPPDIVQDIIMKVIEDPENARQTFYEILGGGMGESAKSNALFVKKALTGDVIYKSENKNDNGYSLAKVLYNPLDKSYKVYALNEKLRRGEGGALETYLAYTYKSTHQDENEAKQQADQVQQEQKATANFKNNFKKVAFPPRTDEERLERHQQKFPKDKVKTQKDLPPRGTGFNRKPLSEIDVEVNEDDLKRGKDIEMEHQDTYNKIKKDIAEDDKLDMSMDDMAESIRDEHLDEYKDYYDEEKGLPAMEKKLKSAKKKEHGEPSAKPPKQWFNEKKKEVKKGNPDYSEDQITKTVGRIWSDLSDSKKKEIREREGKKYKPADKKSSIDNVVIKKNANGEEVTTYYHVKSPSGETIKVTPGQLAMSEGYVTDSKGNKFKPEKFTAESLEDKVAIQKKQMKIQDLDPELKDNLLKHAKLIKYYSSVNNEKSLINAIDKFLPLNSQAQAQGVYVDSYFPEFNEIKQDLRSKGLL